MVLTEKFNFKKLHVYLLLIFISNLIVITSSTESDGVQCIDRERMALLKFQAELIDDYGRLSTWGTGDNKRDCCKWTGIRCDNQTNHVVSLDLQGPLDDISYESNKPLKGKISPFLLELSDISYLDLSLNNFNTTIPKFIGSFRKLQHLNLSHNEFVGSIPPHLGNLSMLRALDLRGNFAIYVEDLDWLTGFHSLQHLDLSYVELEVTTWLKPISKLTQLKKLHLRGGVETLHTTSIPVLNESAKSLSVLDLSHNSLTFPAITWFLNFSSHYSYIDFSFNNLKGKIPNALMNLTSLSYLDLSVNQLEGSIPDTLGIMISLAYLDLSENQLEGSIPDTLGIMISLAYLDLSENQLEGNIPDGIGKLTSISHLDLSSNNLQGVFPHSTGKLKKLVVLQLSHNKLETDLKYMNEFLMKSTTLEFLDLSDNRFYGSIPQLSRFHFLNTLNLQGNQLNGSFTDRKLRLPYLTSLDVSQNRLTGRLPDLASCSSLETLRLSENKFNGTLTETIGYLSKLQKLDLRSNDLGGVISEAHLFNLSTLQYLDLSFNSNLTIRISSDWNPTFQLSTLNLANCNTGPSFPKWLQNQTEMMQLDISNSQIYDIVPGWFWNNSHVLNFLNVSFNHVYGVIPSNILSNFSSFTLDLRSNDFNGSLPRLSFLEFPYIDLSINKFSGEITEFCNAMNGLNFLDLSDNQLSGEPSKECFSKLMTLEYLDLSSNNFSGEIIPSLNSSICVLKSLHLRKNNFRGQLPMSLGYCDYLQILDLGNNHFSGKIPAWIGESLSLINVVSLRSNKFTGTLPSSLCLLTNIHILDLSMNDISGTIPRCLNNFTSMRMKPISSEYNGFALTTNTSTSVFDSAYLMWKGHDTEYANTHTLWQVKAIDLSSNNLVGEIPTEITSLEGLIALNLTRNNLVGSIPRDINKLEFLNFLDLSQNNLSGSIPNTLSELNHLGMLDLSFNNFSGKIPWSTHLETFGSNAFMGNPQLCGLPLLKSCPEDQIPQNPKSTSSEDHLAQDEDMYITRWFFVSMAIGFLLAFWGIFCTLTFNKFYRIKFSKLSMAFVDWCYVKIALNKRAVQRCFQKK